MSDIIQVSYEALQQTASRFTDQGENAKALLDNLRNKTENLRAGAWAGEGADAFYNEMDNLVLPTLASLHQALFVTAQVLSQIMGDFQSSEDEAAQLVNEGDPGGHPIGQGVHTVRPGDTLWDIAQRYGTTVEALVAANNIANRDLIHPGQQLNIPGADDSAPPISAAPVPITPGVSGRNGQALNSQIDQFNVENNPKYAINRQGRGETYCNIYAMDVANSMGAHIPEFVRDGNGTITRYLDANLMKDWLDGRLNVPGQYTQGPAHGWVKVDHATAANAANQGGLVVAAGYGHMAVVRAGSPDGVGVNDVLISQAGASNFNQGSMIRGWGQHMGHAEFYMHQP